MTAPQSPPPAATIQLKNIAAVRAQAKAQGRMKATIEDGLESPSESATLLFGAHADLHNYPASVFDNSTSCSATLLGPQVVLTAAHCAEGDDHIYFSHGGKDFAAFCIPFTGRDVEHNTGDFALCHVEQTGGVTGIATYETLNRNPSLIRMDADVLLTGFGITSAEGTTGTFNVGAATIVEVPSGTSDEIVTEGATIAPGDSGSAMYLVVNNRASRRIIGVNSYRSDFLGEGGQAERRSAATSITGPRAVEFITTWMSQHPGATVCGYTVGANNCWP